jgi:hypothetical protein
VSDIAGFARSHFWLEFSIYVALIGPAIKHSNHHDLPNGDLAERERE